MSVGDCVFRACYAVTADLLETSSIKGHKRTPIPGEWGGVLNKA